MKKANKHRKRHYPPGPCGIWFQRQRQLIGGDGGGVATTSSSLSYQYHQNHHHLHESQGLTQSDSSSPSKQKSSSSSGAGADMNNTWRFMQESLDIVTPYLDLSTSDSPYKRYQQLRPYMPSNFILLSQIGSSSSSSSSYSVGSGVGEEYTSLQIQDKLRLLVEVHSVEATHIHHNILTVQLTDETKTIIRAWLDPNWVQEQNRLRHRDSTKNIIRQGVVWMLKDVGMIIVPKDEQNSTDDQQDEDKIERILLISGKQIERAWTPEEANGYYDDSEIGVKRFKDYMERRAKIQPIHNNDNNERHPGDAEDEEEGEDGPDEEEEALMYRYQQQRQQNTQMKSTTTNATTTTATASSASVAQEDEEAELDRFSRDATIGDSAAFPSLSRLQHQQPVRNEQPQQPQHSFEQPTTMIHRQSQQSPAIDGVSRNRASSTTITSHNEFGREMNTQPSSPSPPPPPLPRQPSTKLSLSSSNLDNRAEVNHLQSQHQQRSFKQFAAATRTNNGATAGPSSSTATSNKVDNDHATNNITTTATQQSQFTQDCNQSQTQEEDDDFDGVDHNDENDNSNNNTSSSTLDAGRKEKTKKKKKKRSHSGGSSSTPTKRSADGNDDRTVDSRMRTPKKRKKDNENDLDNSPRTPITPTRNKNTPVSAIWRTTSQEVEEKVLIDLLDTSSEEEDNCNEDSANLADTSKGGDKTNSSNNNDDSSIEEHENKKMLDATETPYTSIFHPSNLEGIDPTIFSEEE